MFKKIHIFLASQKFTFFILAFIFFNAGYIALTYAYPMLYDEEYHYSVSKELTQSWLPSIENQPTSIDNMGALQGTHQLLFHYFMSMPLRLIEVFTSNLAVEVITLRFINILLFLLGLWLMSKFLSCLKVGPAIRNVTIAIIGLLPVSTLLAATINYDNLLFPVIMYTLLLAARISESKKIVARDYMKLTTIILVGLLIKISYMPVALGIIAYLAYNKRTVLFNKQFVTKFTKAFKNEWSTKNAALAVVLGLLLLFGFSKTMDNLISYGSLSPSCQAQLGENRCGNSILDRRTKQLLSIRSGVPNQLPHFMVDWYGIMQRDALSVNTKRAISTPEDVAPLPVLYMILFVGLIVSIVAVFTNIKALLRRPSIQLFFIVFTLYLLALIYTNIKAYYSTYFPVSVQARYVLPFMAVILGLGLSSIATTIPKSKKNLTASISIIFLVTYVWAGAGAVTYISRSTPAWYWNNNKVRSTGGSIKEVVQPFIKEGWYDK